MLTLIIPEYAQTVQTEHWLLDQWGFKESPMHFASNVEIVTVTLPLTDTDIIQELWLWGPDHHIKNAQKLCFSLKSKRGVH